MLVADRQCGSDGLFPSPSHFLSLLLRIKQKFHFICFLYTIWYSFFLLLFFFLSFVDYFFSSISSLIIWFHLIFILNLILILLISIYLFIFFIIFLIEFCFSYHSSTFDFDLFLYQIWSSFFYCYLFFFCILFLLPFFFSQFFPSVFCD